MTIDPTTAYFDDVVMRATTSRAICRNVAPDALPNCCHANCKAFDRGSSEYEIVRGWLVIGGHWLMPHSVVRHILSGQLIDITPDPGNSGAIPFVEHRGSERDFTTLRKGRDGGWLHPQP